MRNPFRYFNSSPEVTGLAVMMHVRYPLSLRQVEDLLFERGIDICHETVRYAEADDIAYHDGHRLVISTNDPRLFYLATGEGLYRSGDGGQSWEHLMLRAGRIGYPDFLFFDPRDDDTLFLGGARNDPGKWFSDPMAPAFEALCLHHWDGGMMLAVGTATGEIYVSEDDGGSWTCMEDRATARSPTG